MNRIVPALLLAGALACGPLDRHETAPSGDHAHQTIAHTCYTADMEFFLEHPPLIAGEKARFIVHCTRLSDYSPIASGCMTLTLGGETVKSTEPVDEGIYELEIAAPKAGLLELDLAWQAGELLQRIHAHVEVYEDHKQLHAEPFSPAGHRDPADHDSKKADADHAHQNTPFQNPESSGTGDIIFHKEQAWKTDFMVSRAETAPYAAVIRTTGELMPSPGEIKRQTAPARGMIEFADPELVQGAYVNAGKHLFTIRSGKLPGDNLELRLQQAENRLTKSRSDYLRHQELLKAGATSKKAFLASQSTYRADSLLYSDLGKDTGPGGMKIFAENSGSIHLLNVSNGSFVETGQALLTISSDQKLLLRADLPQPQAHFGKEIQTANFRPAYAKEAWSMEDFNGKHLSTGHSVAENEHYLPVYFVLENDGRLMEGAFTEVYLIGRTLDSALLVPNTALLEEQGNFYVYVQKGGESYEKRAVDIGPGDGRETVIKTGLAKGERFVSRGCMLLKAASTVRTAVGDGHTH